MNLRGIATCFALSLILAFERAAYFGVRSVLRPYLVAPSGQGLGLSSLEASTLNGLWSAAVNLSPVLGGVLGYAIGPRPVLLSGLLLAAVGYLLMGRPDASLVVACALTALGTGLVRPAVFAVVAQEFGRGLDNVRAAACCALFLAINLGAFSSSLVARTTVELAGFTSVFTGAAASLFVTAVIAAALLAALRRSGAGSSSPDRARAPDADPIEKSAPATPDPPREVSALVFAPPGETPGANLDLPGDIVDPRLNAALLRRSGEPREAPRRAVGWALLVLVAVAPAFVANAAFDGAQLNALDVPPSSVTSLSISAASLLGLQGVANMAVTVLATIGLLVMAFTVRRRVPVLYAVALGLVLIAAGCAAQWLGSSSVMMGGLVVAPLLVGAGGALVSPLSMTRVLTGGSPRAAPLWAAAWLILSVVVSWGPYTTAPEASGTWMAISMAACVAAGVTLAAFARRIERGFD